MYPRSINSLYFTSRTHQNGATAQWLLLKIKTIRSISPMGRSQAVWSLTLASCCTRYGSGFRVFGFLMFLVEHLTSWNSVMSNVCFIQNNTSVPQYQIQESPSTINLIEHGIYMYVCLSIEREQQQMNLNCWFKP